MAASKTAERSHDGTHKDLAQFIFATTMLVHAPADITRAGRCRGERIRRDEVHANSAAF